MKKARTLIVTALLLTAVSIGTQAQRRPIAKANIPFAFAVHNATLPAGTYTVSVLGSFEDVIEVQSADGRNSAMFSALRIEEPRRTSQSRLVFRRIGDEYFLEQVWLRGSAIHRDVQTDRHEIELAKRGEKREHAVILASNTR